MWISNLRKCDGRGGTGEGIDAFLFQGGHVWHSKRKPGTELSAGLRVERDRHSLRVLHIRGMTRNPRQDHANECSLSELEAMT